MGKGRTEETSKMIEAMGCEGKKEKRKGANMK